MRAGDVAVRGGGPAGSVGAAWLAARGRRVLLFEREHHPRFHLGESLLPMSLDVLDAIGVLDAVRGRFLVKRGARFIDGADESRAVRYAFADAFRPHRDSAFQVPRDEFDELLFRHAGACGASLREGWSAVRVLQEAGRAVGVEVQSPDGSLVAFAARFVVDATGRDALTARAAGGVERIAGLDRTAIFTQVRGAWRDTGEREGDIQIAIFGQGAMQGWFWLIPFADGRTSAGVVVSPTWVRARGPKGGAPALFDGALDEAPVVKRMLGSSERLFVPRATSDFSFRVQALAGAGWLALGDAGGFIDPLFSTGAHLAMSGALRAADVLNAGLEADDLGPERFASWERDQRAGAGLFVDAVQAFYAGKLVPYLFAQPQHPFLRRAVTSMLSGDVFDPGARWAREMKSWLGEGMRVGDGRS
jgi:flavin-dependent dehydrogenase